MVEESTRARVFGICILLSLLGGSLVWYGTLSPAPDLHDYPTATEALERPSVYVYDHVVVSGTVIDSEPLHVKTGQGVVFTVTGTKSDIHIGQKIRVYGTLTDSQSVNASNVISIDRAGLWYTWSVSFIAGLWALVRIVQHWQFNTDQMGFQPREDPVSLTDVFSKVL